MRWDILIKRLSPKCFRVLTHGRSVTKSKETVSQGSCGKEVGFNRSAQLLFGGMTKWQEETKIWALWGDGKSCDPIMREKCIVLGILDTYRSWWAIVAECQPFFLQERKAICYLCVAIFRVIRKKGNEKTKMHNLTALSTLELLVPALLAFAFATADYVYRP